MMTKLYGASLTADMPRRSVVARVSTTTVDDANELMLPEGIDTSRFRKTGTVFWNHGYGTPCGTCDGIRVMEDGIEARTIFPEKPEGYSGSWLPDDVFAMLTSDPPLVQSFSIGFSYLEVRNPTDRDRARFKDINPSTVVVSKSRLLEYSIAPLPCNEDALVSAVQKGIVSAATVDAIRVGARLMSKSVLTARPVVVRIRR